MPINTALYCAMCNIYCHTQSVFQIHMRGKKHRARERAGGDPTAINIPIHCSLCSKSIPGGENNWSIHVDGRPHKRLAALDPTHIERSFITLLADLPPGMKRCDTCQIFVLATAQQSHISSGRHQYKTKLQAIRSTLQESEKDKYGITISHPDGLDLGMIEVASLVNQPTTKANFTITATDQSIRFTGSRLSSESVTRATSQYVDRF